MSDNENDYILYFSHICCFVLNLLILVKMFLKRNYNSRVFWTAVE